MDEGKSVTIDCMYSCHQCGIVKAHVAVPVRQPDEDVATWVMDRVATAISLDHDARSPQCSITKLDEVYIPTDGRDYIGGPVKN
jgi:hypothetical protein